MEDNDLAEVTPRQVEKLTSGDIKRANARQALLVGVSAGVFEEAEPSPCPTCDTPRRTFKRVLSEDA